MKRQYRIIEKHMEGGGTYYDVECRYPYLPFWFFIGCRSTPERAHDKIAYEKEQRPLPKPKVIYRE